MTAAKRRTVRCWNCGHKARRKPDMASDLLTVVGRRRRVRSYGLCGHLLGRSDCWECMEVMLLPADAAFVLRAAIEHERRGGNLRSEYDA